MATYIQAENGLKKIADKTTKANIEKALGHSLSNFSGDYNNLKNKPEIIEDGSEELNITDPQGNVIAKITKEGIQALNFFVGEDKKEVALKENIPEETNLEEINSKITQATSDASSALSAAQEANTLATEAKATAETASADIEDLKTNKSNKNHTHTYSELSGKPDISVDSNGVMHMRDNASKIQYADNSGNVIMEVDANGLIVSDVKILVNGNLISLAEAIATLLNNQG